MHGPRDGEFHDDDDREHDAPGPYGARDDARAYGPRRERMEHEHDDGDDMGLARAWHPNDRGHRAGRRRDPGPIPSRRHGETEWRPQGRRWEEIGPVQKISRKLAPWTSIYAAVAAVCTVVSVLWFALGGQTIAPNARTTALEQGLRETRAALDSLRSVRAELTALRASLDSLIRVYGVQARRTDALARFRCYDSDVETLSRILLDCQSIIPDWEAVRERLERERRRGGLGSNEGDRDRFARSSTRLPIAAGLTITAQRVAALRASRDPSNAPGPAPRRRGDAMPLADMTRRDRYDFHEESP
jgi:hypothetical protein